MSAPPIYIISGGRGASGEQVVRTALAQFQDASVPVTIVPHIYEVAQLTDAVVQAATTGGIIVHTLVDAELRQALIRLARQHNVEAIDLMGHLLSRLSAILGQTPLGQPGLYRQLREAYFERVEAIEFAVAHDDGRNPHELHLAEIVLVGVSRTGKTPLSMYLSVQGWKVANVPLISSIEPPNELFQIDPGRVVGLTIEPGQLVAHRRWRQRHLGIQQDMAYATPTDIAEEVAAARAVCQRGGFAMLNVTDRPIEESAQEVIALITRRSQNRID